MPGLPRTPSLAALATALALVCAACSASDQRSADPSAAPGPADATTSTGPSPSTSSPADHDHGGSLAEPGDDEPATISIDGTAAFLRGTIAGPTAGVIRDMAATAPEVDTLIFVSVPGAVSTEAAVEAGRAIAELGLATHALPGATISKAGLLTFLGGARRTIAAEVDLAIGSWLTDDGDDLADRPADDPAHDLALNYLDDRSLDPDLYWLMIAAASPGTSRSMTAEEIDRFEILTLS